MPTSPSSERELHLARFPRWLFRPTGSAAPSAATKHDRDSRLKPFAAQCQATMRSGSDPAERRTGTLLEGRFGSTVIRPSSKPTAVSLSANGTSSSIRLWQRWSRPRGDCPWWNYRYNALGSADPVIARHQFSGSCGGWRTTTSATRGCSRTRSRRPGLPRSGTRPTADLPWETWEVTLPAPDRPDGRPTHLARKVRATEEAGAGRRPTLSAPLAERPGCVSGLPRSPNSERTSTPPSSIAVQSRSSQRSVALRAPSSVQPGIM